MNASRIIRGMTDLNSIPMTQVPSSLKYATRLKRLVVSPYSPVHVWKEKLSSDILDEVQDNYSTIWHYL